MVKVEDRASRNLASDMGLPLSHVYLDDGRIVDRDTGEFVDTLGKVLDRDYRYRLGLHTSEPTQ
jgi:hypothetical protein